MTDINEKYAYNRFGSKATRVGQAVSDILSKENLPEVTVEEILEASKDKFLKDLEECVETGRKKYTSPFYVFVIMKKEMWAVNVIRNYFIARQTKPKMFDMMMDYPNATKTLYMINDNTGEVKLEWTLPGLQECESILKTPLSFDPSLISWIRECFEVEK